MQTLSTAALRRLSWLALTVMLAVQVGLIVACHGVEQRPDSCFYQELARRAATAGEWYPSALNIHDDFIYAAGLVNVMIASLRLSGSLVPVMLLNLLLNLGIILMGARLARHYFGVRVAYIFTTMYALLYSTWWAAVPTVTEVPFLFLALLALCLMHRRGVWWALAAGIALALANWVRPLAVIFLATGLVVMWQRKARYRSYATLFVGLAATVALLGLGAKHTTGYFTPQATTSGVNLAIAYNEHSWGYLYVSLLEDTTNQVLHIEGRDSYTYAEKDSIWRTRALHYMAAHPVKAVAAFFLKVPGQFSGDAWADGYVLNTVGQVSLWRDTAVPLSRKIGYSLGYIGKSLVYYAVCLLFLLGLWRKRRELLSRRATLLLPVVFGVLINCILVSTPRYHYPFFFAVVIWAAYYAEGLIGRKLCHEV